MDIVSSLYFGVVNIHSLGWANSTRYMDCSKNKYAPGEIIFLLKLGE